MKIKLRLLKVKHISEIDAIVLNYTSESLPVKHDEIWEAMSKYNGETKQALTSLKLEIVE